MKRNILTPLLIGATLTSLNSHASPISILSGEWETKCGYRHFDTDKLRCIAYIENKNGYLSIEPDRDKVRFFYEDRENKEGHFSWNPDMETLQLKADNKHPINTDQMVSVKSYDEYESYLSFALESNSEAAKKLLKDMQSGKHFRANVEMQDKAELFTEHYVEAPLEGFKEAWDFIESEVQKNTMQTSHR